MKFIPLLPPSSFSARACPHLRPISAARPYGKAPGSMRRRSTTGPASTSAVTSAAPSAAATVSTASPAAMMTADSSAACRLAPTTSSPATSWSASKASTPGSAATRSARSFPAGFVYSNNQRGLGSVTGRLGYSWGPALFYVKGGYAYSDYSETLTFGGAPVAFTLNSSHHDGYTVGAGLEYHVHAELVGQGRVSVLRLRQEPASSRRPRWSRSAAPQRDTP